MTAIGVGTTRRSSRLSRDRLVEAARSLLVAGGTDAIVIREVARNVGVVPSALYKHVDGRDDLLTLLIAALYDELTGAVVAMRDAVPPGRPRARLNAATQGLRTWARAHPAEFDLLFGFPLQGYAAPPDGPTTDAARRFGAAFLEVFAAALATGRLRVREESSLPGDVAEQFRDASLTAFAGLSPGELYPVVVGFQRMLGLVMIEVTGQLRWVLADPTPVTDEQLDRLADDLLTPGP
jgi:AcrR family transcriptional regulator